MKAIVSKVIKRYFYTEALKIDSLGGGFYGRVFLATLNAAPFKVVVKIYLKDGLGLKESLQLKLLAQHALMPMPKVYEVHLADEVIGRDVLLMEYMTGVNAGLQDQVNEDCLDAIGDRIVDNLIALHTTTNPNGFGELDGNHSYKDWRLFYKPKVKHIYKSATNLHAKGQLDDQTYGIVWKAYEKFDDIFYLPITRSSLIHGDYNTWNILLNQARSEAVGVIDPFGSCWADSEYDLYQLDNANGKYYGLLERYKQKLSVSENFDLKNCFYELFTEIMHYHDAHVSIDQSDIPATALRLARLMEENDI